MSPSSSGLRFDIYERVYLPDNTAGISELNGIELTPEIRVVAEGEQAVLKGHLNLFVTYTGDDEARIEEQFEQRIPVEITLPLNRVKDINDIRIEIDNVDVDVLSARSLNVTGVLSLDGFVSVSQAQEGWLAAPDREEVTFSHRIEEPAPEAEKEAEFEPFLQEKDPLFGNAAPEMPEMPEMPNPQYDNAPSGWDGPASDEQDEHGKQDAQNDKRVKKELPKEKEETGAAGAMEETFLEPATEPNLQQEPDWINAPFDAPLDAPNEPKASMEADSGPPKTDERPDPVAGETESERPVLEKQEIKIAFSGKSEEQADNSPVSVNHILSKAAESADKVQEQPQEQPELQGQEKAEETYEAKDRMEWQKLFLRTSNENPSFRKVRMCIVQKEETLETIAERYKKNVREIMLYNRMSDEYLVEGQIVYIP